MKAADIVRIKKSHKVYASQFVIDQFIPDLCNFSKIFFSVLCLNVYYFILLTEFIPIFVWILIYLLKGLGADEVRRKSI